MPVRLCQFGNLCCSKTYLGQSCYQCIQGIASWYQVDVNVSRHIICAVMKISVNYEAAQ